MSITLNSKKLGHNTMLRTLIKVANRIKTIGVRAKLLQILNLLLAIRYIGSCNLLSTLALADFEDLFKVTECIRRIHNIDVADVVVIKNMPRWLLNLFASLL